jgi:ribosomal protein S14
MGINWIKNDKNYRKNYFKFEIKKIVLKSLLYNNNTFILKLYFDKYFKKFSKYTSISQCRTNCLFLKNSRSIFKRFKMSRHIAKKYASHGFLTGLKKSSF